MTRLEALYLAQSIVSRSRNPDRDRIVAGLEKCIKRENQRKWSEEAIIDYCNKVVEEKGRLLMSDFGVPGAPSPGSVACAFKMSARTFRDTYYGVGIKGGISPMPPYFQRTAEEWTQLFVADYQRVQPKSLTQYNRDRDKTLPRGNVIIRINGAKGWKDLLCKLGLKDKPLYDGPITITATSLAQLDIDRLRASIVSVNIEQQKRRKQNKN